MPFSERTFRSLLRCFPADYRNAYGEELLQFFRDRWADEVRERGRLKAVLAWPAIIFDIRSTMPTILECEISCQ